MSVQAHGDGILSTLRAITLSNRRLLVGDAQHSRPAGAGWQGAPGRSAFVPYCVFYPLDGIQFDGNLETAFDTVGWPFQITSVGASRAQIALVSDAVRAALRPTNIVIAGRTVLWVEPEGGGGIRRDDDTGEPALFSQADIYRLYTSS